MAELTIAEARKILEVASFQTAPVSAEQLRQALLTIARQSERDNLGVCADRAEQGFVALNQYLTALGYRAGVTATAAEREVEPIYIKYNAEKQSHYCDRYTGRDRGVLVSCQSEEDEVNGTFGYFPLDLFTGLD